MKEYHIKQTGYAVRYLDFPGEEPPIVFLHGLGCASSFEYPSVAAQPALRGRRALMIDLLGAGYSDRPPEFGYSVEDHAAYLNEMLSAMQLNDIFLFGHSLGGAVALELARLCPARVRKLILTESNLDPSPVGATSRRIASHSEEDFVNHGYQRLLASAQSRNPLWGATLAHWLPAAAWRISRSAARGGTPSWRDGLYALTMPKLFLIGEKSPPAARDDALTAHGVIVDIVPHVGHNMSLEDPAAIAGRIASFIKESDGAHL